jgi:hypothetical protein
MSDYRQVDYDVHCIYCKKPCFGLRGQDWVMVECRIYVDGPPSHRYVICRRCYDREIMGQGELFNDSNAETGAAK